MSLDLVVAIVDRAIKDFLRDPKRYSDALPFVAQVANGRLVESGDKRITSPEELGEALKTTYRSKGAAA